MVENTGGREALRARLSLGAQTTAKIIAEQGGTQAAAMVAQAAVRHVARRRSPTASRPAVAKGLAREAMRAAGREVLEGRGQGSRYQVRDRGRLRCLRRRQGLPARRDDEERSARARGAGGLDRRGRRPAPACCSRRAFVAVTGGAAAPLVFAVGAGGAIGAKQVLRRLIGRVSSKVLARNVADGGQVG